MPLYTPPNRKTGRGTTGRERRNANVQIVPGSNQYSLTDIADREILQDLLSVLEITATGVTVLGTLTANAINTDTALVVNTLTSDTINTNTINVDNLNANSLVFGSVSIDSNNRPLFGTTVHILGTNHTVNAPETYIIVNAGASDRTITLPQVNTCENTILYVKKLDAGAGSVIVQGYFQASVANTYEYTVSRSTIETNATLQFQSGRRYNAFTGGIAGSYEQIDGANSYTINTANASIAVVGTNTDWYIISGFSG